MIALESGFAPFSKVVLCDLAVENVKALEHRTARHMDRVKIVHGDANEKISELIEHLPSQGLNLAFIDPFGLRPLHFETVRALASLKRMDLIVNFPTSDIRRNQDLYLDPNNDFIARMLGTEKWRSQVKAGDLGLQAMQMFIHSLATLGYTGADNRTIRVTSPGGAELYRIVFAGKHRLADRIWNDITKHTARGQRGLFE
jgi:three-Cys-motif partner protein